MSHDFSKWSYNFIEFLILTMHIEANDSNFFLSISIKNNVLSKLQLLYFVFTT